MARCDVLRRKGYPSVVTIAAAGVAIGLFPMPPEYYVLLRFLLCGVAVWLLSETTSGPDVIRWLLVGIAILFNPIVPIELGRGAIWAIAHIGAVAYFWVLIRRIARRPRW